MKAYASLWSADLLALGEAVDLVDALVDGYHIDIMDGVCVPDLLFGLDFITALRRRTKKILDVHLMLTNTNTWIDRYADAGSDLLTIHRQFCDDVSMTLKQIRSRGIRAGLVVEIRDPLSMDDLHLDLVDRLLVMGTEIGMKGKGLHSDTTQRIGAILELCRQAGRRPEIVVDGGIRRETVPLLAQSGADGVVPGSLVFGETDPRAALNWIHAQGRRTAQPGGEEPSP
jgi:ribulose-phosphate 3-epimerase